MTSRTQRGFTLIELMTVLAIVAILTVSLAAISNTRPGNPRTTAHEVTGLIQFARLRAEARRSKHIVRFESSQVVSIWESVMGASGVAADTPRTGFGAITNVTQIQFINMPAGVLLWAAERPVRATAAGALAQNANLSTPFDITIEPDGSTDGGTLYLTSDPDEVSQRFRVFVYQVTGTALSREGW